MISFFYVNFFMQLAAYQSECDPHSPEFESSDQFEISNLERGFKKKKKGQLSLLFILFFPSFFSPSFLLSLFINFE